MVKKSAELVNSGPYKYVRHPMYSLILISSIVCLIESTTIGLSVLCYLLLFLDLFFKARIEENFLRKHFPNYAEMMTAKKRFFPLLI